jgi:hypothetical protein
MVTVVAIQGHPIIIVGALFGLAVAGVFIYIFKRK